MVTALARVRRLCSLHCCLTAAFRGSFFLLFTLFSILPLFVLCLSVSLSPLVFSQDRAKPKTLNAYTENDDDDGMLTFVFPFFFLLFSYFFLRFRCGFGCSAASEVGAQAGQAEQGVGDRLGTHKHALDTESPCLSLPLALSCSPSLALSRFLSRFLSLSVSPRSCCTQTKTLTVHARIIL